MMREFTIRYIQLCKSQGASDTFQSSSSSAVYTAKIDGTHEECNCPGFKRHRKCKHITELDSRICGWDEELSSERQTPQQEMEGICPCCGRDTFVVREGG